jgi:hypothetical protein
VTSMVVLRNLVCPLEQTHSDWSAASRRTAIVPIGTQKILFDHQHKFQSGVQQGGSRVAPKPTFWVKNGNNHFLAEFQGGQRWIYSIHPAVQI